MPKPGTVLVDHHVVAVEKNQIGESHIVIHIYPSEFIFFTMIKKIDKYFRNILRRTHRNPIRVSRPHVEFIVLNPNLKFYSTKNQHQTSVSN